MIECHLNSNGQVLLIQSVIYGHICYTNIGWMWSSYLLKPLPYRQFQYVMTHEPFLMAHPLVIGLGCWKINEPIWKEGNYTVSTVKAVM